MADSPEHILSIPLRASNADCNTRVLSQSVMKTQILPGRDCKHIWWPNVCKVKIDSKVYSRHSNPEDQGQEAKQTLACHWCCHSFLLFSELVSAVDQPAVSPHLTVPHSEAEPSRCRLSGLLIQQLRFYRSMQDEFFLKSQQELAARHPRSPEDLGQRSCLHVAPSCCRLIVNIQ